MITSLLDAAMARVPDTSDGADGPDIEYFRGGAFECPWCYNHPRLGSLDDWLEHVEDEHGVSGPL